MEAATPRRIAGPATCDFYHSIDLPSWGRQEGAWDLIGRFDDYIAHQQLEGRTLLDVGTASGFLTFEAELRGARVTSFDAASADQFAQLPIRGTPFVEDYPAWRERADLALEAWKNSYWLSHGDLQSSASCVYGDIYDLDPTDGTFDVVLLGQILIHLRDGVSALAAAASVCRETLIVVEGSFDDGSPLAALSGRANRPDVAYAWYQYSYGWYREVLAMLGFTRVEISAGRFTCNQADHAPEIELATVVATR